jgi:hypothetical protein
MDDVDESLSMMAMVASGYHLGIPVQFSLTNYCHVSSSFLPIGPVPCQSLSSFKSSFVTSSIARRVHDKFSICLAKAIMSPWLYLRRVSISSIAAMKLAGFLVL